MSLASSGVCVALDTSEHFPRGVPGQNNSRDAGISLSPFLLRSACKRNIVYKRTFINNVIGILTFLDATKLLNASIGANTL